MASTLPSLEQLAKRLKRIRGVKLGVTGYRSTTPRYAREGDITSGAGSREFGGRWNPPGISAVYASLTPETAMEEALAHFRYYGIPAHAAMPRTFVAIRAELSKVLDLTRGRVRQRLRISEKRLMQTDWRKDLQAGKTALTQLVGLAAFETEFEGLLVPSAADQAGRNLVVFPENLLDSSRLEVLDPDELEP